MATLTREQLEERLAALHRASLELVKEITLESLLERIATIACEQAGASYAAVGVLDKDGHLERFIPIGMTKKQIAAMPHPPLGKGLIGVLMRSKQPIRLDDLHQDARSFGFPKGHPSMSSFLGVPIRQGEQALGQIYLTKKPGVTGFTKDDQRVIEVLAAYAASAISNARLYTDLTQRDTQLMRRSENLALLNQLAVTLANSADIDEILNQALAQVMGYLKLEVGEIYLCQEGNNILKRVLHRGERVESLWKVNQFQVGKGIIGLTAKKGVPNVIALPGKDGSEVHASVIKNCFREIACFPLIARKGPVGVLCVAACQRNHLDETEQQFLSSISAWIGTAIENVQLNQQGKRLAILEERERIGMDLHDGIIQSIYAVGLTLEHARLLLKENPEEAKKRINQSVNDLNSAIRDIRAYILDLRPRSLHDEGIMDGIKRLVQEFRTNTLVEVNLQGPASGLENLGRNQATALFHICQEALANIGRHAHAKRVDVILWVSNDRLLMEIKDDGRGFDQSRIKMSIGHGLANIQTRAKNAGGDVDIASEPGKGTSVLTWVPLLLEE
jgi:two-component system sensor histidine kinase DevS